MVIAIGVVVAIVLALVGNGVAVIIVGTHCLSVCFVIFNLIIVSGEENPVYLLL